MNNPTSPTRYQVSTEALSQEVNGETVILDLKSEQYFSLNAVGARVWQLLAENRDTSEISTILLEEFEVESARLNQDVDCLLQALSQEGLIVDLDESGQKSDV